MLHKKLLRDLLRQRWQVLAVIVVVLLGTALFDGSYLAYENLQHSYATTQKQTRLADMSLSTTGTTEQQVARVAAIPGVSTAASQMILSLPVRVSKALGASATQTVDGRLISIPLGTEPQLNQVVVVNGRYPTKATQILVERHFADYYHIKPGTRIQIQTPSGFQSVTVSGVAVSAKYLWVARNRQDVFPSPADFGVFYVPRQTLLRVAKKSLASLKDNPAASAASTVHNLQLAADGTMANTVLYSVASGANAEKLLPQVKAVLGVKSVISATPRNKEIDIELLQMDLNGFKQMAEAFPAFFLTVAAFIVAALMNRLVNQERSIIGTMMAIGIRRRRILLHYLAYAVFIGLLGTLLGTLAGVWMGDAMTHAYASELHIPFVSTNPDWAVVFAGIGLGLVAPFLAGLLPALRASQLRPADAMRQIPAHPTRRNSGGHARRSFVPLLGQLAVRDVLRRPGRTLGTAIGIIAALVLVITTGGLEDSMARGLYVTLNQSQLYDLRVDFYAPQPTAQVFRQMQSVSGVKTVQAMDTLPVQIENVRTGKSYDTVLQGLSPKTTLLQLRSAQGRRLQPTSGKAVLTQSVAKKLGIKVGEKVQVKLLPEGKKVTVTVGSLGFSTLGNSITLPLSEVNQAFGLHGQVTTALLTTAPSAHQGVRQALGKMHTIARVQDEASFREQVQQLTGLMNLLLGTMLIAAVILAASILFNTASLNILERQRELATMRALGYRMRAIAGMVTMGNAVIALIGVVVGFPLALLSLRAFLKLYTTDLFSIPFWVNPKTVIVAVGGILLVLVLAQWPSLRMIRRMNLAQAAKIRE